jgi:hypothetical protein
MDNGKEQLKRQISAWKVMLHFATIDGDHEEANRLFSLILGAEASLRDDA